MFFFKLNWKYICRVYILLFSFVTEVSLLAFGDSALSPTDLLNRVPKNNDTSNSSTVTLAEALLNAEKERREFLKYNIFLADIFSGQTDTDLSDRYLNCIKDLELNSRKGLRLVNSVFDLCKYFEGKIEQMPLSYDEKLKMKLRLDELREDAEKYGITLRKKDEAQHVSECTILETNEELEVVVLGTGFLDNSEVGKIWVIPEANNTEVKVVAVRPYASGAIVIKGHLDTVLPGMKAKRVK